MASIYQEANGSRRIGFTNLEGERKSIRLGMMNAKTADTFCKRVEELLGNQAANHSNDAELSTWLRDLPEIMYGRLAATGLVPPREALKVLTLGELIERFEESSIVKPGTLTTYRQAFTSLTEYFKAGTLIDSITASHAEQWRKWLARTSKEEPGLAPATQAKRLKVARALFACAVRWELLTRSPFAQLRAGSQANPERSFYVPVAAIEAVLNECPSDEWRAIIALSRFAGLRCPSEVGLLRWADIHWDKGTMTVRSPKTAGHEGHAVRFVPMQPALREILERLFEAATEGEEFVIPKMRDPTVNLRNSFERMLTRANVKAWPRLFHNMRASCATDWAEKLPAHVVAKWLGHSPMIAAAHYLQTRDDHVASVTGMHRPTGDNCTLIASATSDGSASDADQKHPPRGGAKSGAFSSRTRSEVVQNRVQQQPASTRTNSENHAKRPRNRGLSRELAVCGESLRNQINDPDGIRTHVTSVKGMCPGPG